jgi:hypothetical protein
MSQSLYFPSLLSSLLNVSGPQISSFVKWGIEISTCQNHCKNQIQSWLEKSSESVEFSWDSWIIGMAHTYKSSLQAAVPHLTQHNKAISRNCSVCVCACVCTCRDDVHLVLMSVFITIVKILKHML